MNSKSSSAKGGFKIGMKLLANMLERFIQKGTMRVIEADGTISEFVGTPEPSFNGLACSGLVRFIGCS